MARDRLRDTGRHMRSAILAILFAGSAFAQRPALVSSDFEQGQPGERPPGWLFGFGPKLGYSALIVTDSCNSGKQCAMIRSNDPLPSDGHSFLYQYVDAKPYRGMKFRFRAAVKTRGNWVAQRGRTIGSDSSREQEVVFRQHERA